MTTTIVSPAFKILFNQACAHQQQGDIERAIFLCQSILAEKPDHLDALNLLATLAFQRKSFGVCIEACDAAIKIDSSNPKFHTTKASAQQNLNRNDAALASYDCALAIAPDIADTWFSRGLLLQSMNRNSDALFSYNRTLVLWPSNPILPECI
jgi:tetratricopeptide (TPR) repeat protein